jgi:hypothetical protein
LTRGNVNRGNEIRRNVTRGNEISGKRSTGKCNSGKRAFMEMARGEMKYGELVRGETMIRGIVPNPATNFSDFHNFWIILYLITQRFFFCVKQVWYCWEGILLNKIQKINKPTTIKHHLKWNCSKCTPLKNLMKIMMNNNYMTYLCFKPFT